MMKIGEIESVIREHPAAAQVAVAVRDGLPFAYVVPADSDGAGSAALTQEHLRESRQRFDHEHREGRTAPPPNPTAVERIRAARPKRLLEIGCGAGVLLRELLPACERYVATDFSSVAINRLRSELPGTSGLMLLAREATDFRGFGDRSFDAVVIDAVIRHLPGLHTADEVITHAVSALGDGGTLIITDIPRHGDNELIIDPAYFSGLPDRIARVAGVKLIDRPDCYDALVTVAAPRPLTEPGVISPGLANDPARARRAERLSKEIRNLTRRRLPADMVPAGILIMNELPLSPNGEVDVRQLPVLSVRSEGHTPRGTGKEEALCSLFAEILDLKAVSPDDGFFDLGGHSLQVFRLQQLIRSRLGTEIPLETIFEEPTPTALSDYLNQPTI
ncbi:MAG: phosphopantetheine-binding protein [Trebonia sp.]